MGHEHEVVIKEEKFEMSAKDKKVALGLLIGGFVLALIGYFTAHAPDHHMVVKRLWANLIADSYFFFIISLCATAFIAIKAIANAGWHTSVKRIPEAMGTFMPFAAVVLIAVLFLGGHDIYHWMHEGVTDTNSPNYDKIIAGKSGYLNIPFFMGRLIVFAAMWILFARTFRKWSLQEDIDGGLTNFDKTYKAAAAFVFLFAFTFSSFSWDVMMSIDVHWFSTIFSVYNFATGWVSAITCIALFTIYLKSRGYLNIVNDDVIHDLGKMMFAFSVFWTYLWVAQMLLIWYANIPEEVTYYKDRVRPGSGWSFHFYLNVACNFVFPFFTLMMRDAKRNKKWLVFVGAVLLFGHWNDVYTMTFVGAMKDHNGVSVAPGWGLMEIGFLAMFAGGFIYTVLTSLTKANLYPTKHPYIMESALHDVGV